MRLNFYKMRTKAEVVEVTDEYGLLALAGPECATRLKKLHPEWDIDGAQPGTVFIHDGEIHLFKDPRHEAFGWRLLAPVSRLPELWDALAAEFTPVGLQAWEHQRMAAMLPRSGFELVPDKTMPLEVGYDELNAVSFTKGCYIGQETIARAHHRGTIRFRLYGISMEDGAAVQSGTPVLLPDGKEAGRMASVSHLAGQSIGLAVLRISDVESGQPLSVDGHPIKARKPDWANW